MKTAHKIKWCSFVYLWILMVVIEFLYIDVFRWPLMNDVISMPSGSWTSLALPMMPDSISDGVLWSILTLSGPIIHCCLLFFRSKTYKLSTPEFVRIFGSIPPFLAILTSLLKFTVCEPRPNFLARCFMGQNESALPDNEYGLMVLNNTVSFNVHDCPNPNQIKVQKGLLSFPSGHASHSFGIFHFLYRLCSSNIPTDYHPHLISIIYLFPILCSTSRLVDNQHHLHDIIIGGVLGLIGGNFIYSTMMPENESDKSSDKEILKSAKKKSSKNSMSQEELVVNDDVTFLPK